MPAIFPENDTMDKARTNRFLRYPIIFNALFQTLIGKNKCGINEAIENFDWEGKKGNKLDLLKLKLKIIYYRYAYEFPFEEFFGFGLEKASKKKCLEYIPSYEKIRIYNELIIDKPAYEVFINKYNTYKMYKDYYKRDVIYVGCLQDIVAYSQFCAKHRKFIVKPVTSNNGRGIFIVDLEKEGRSSKEVFSEILSLSGALVEEYVVQNEEIAQFHRESVNTLRFTTYYSDGVLTVIHAMIRFGTGDSVVDNASSGGVAVNVDPETGIINSDGHTKKCQVYTCHPDTNIPFYGVQLPDWDEFRKMVDELVRVYPDQKLVGWDFVYGKQGWEIIEANAGPGIFPAQICAGHGFREIFSKTIFKDSKNYKKYASAKL